MGGLCSMHGRDKKCVPNILQETSNGKDAFEDLGTDGELMLKPYGLMVWTALIWLCEKC